MSVKVKAVYALYSNVVKTVNDGISVGEETIYAYDINDNEVTLNMTNINNWVDPNAYVDKRVAEYPSIGEQLDDIYHNGVDEWKKTIKAVKDKYPKE